jgi:hypothetical protein
MFTQGEWKVKHKINVESSTGRPIALKNLRKIYANLIDNSRPLDFWQEVDKALAKAEDKGA